MTTTTLRNLTVKTSRVRDGLAARRRRRIVARDETRRDFARRVGAYPAMGGIGMAGLSLPDSMPQRTR